MKILMIHNKYGKHSGEESVVYAQIKLLEENGHKVVTYFRSSEELETMPLGKAKAFFLGLKNSKAIADIKQIIKDEKPDLAHVHNLYPIISPAILPVIKKMGVPIVMTIHNYRLLCPNGLFFTKGAVCEKCTGSKRELNSIINNCEGSILKSSGYALRNLWSRITKKYENYIDSYLCLTSFQKEKLVQNGFEESKCLVIPNFFNKKLEDKNYDISDKNYIAFAGRISPEKGLPILLAAAKKLPKISFHLAGLMRPGYRQELEIPKNVVLRGMLNADEMKTFYEKAKILVHTSICYEGFPMVFPEAMAYKLPIIAPDLAGYPEIVEHNYNGLLFKPQNSNDLADKIVSIWTDKEKLEVFGKNGFQKVNKNYSKQFYFDILLEAYQKNIITPNYKNYEPIKNY
ncbi:glycosyltransferase family 4 protein [Polaribacter sp. Asnod6-C07]|uniref:glycosyltransferase family 4 protein n=1 Tax=Polaribacter sp. Asnod6-C07 TaxID=3160582 RepID=UPI00386BD837